MGNLEGNKCPAGSEDGGEDIVAIMMHCVFQKQKNKYNQLLKR
jgi:hypothetical protein